MCHVRGAITQLVECHNGIVKATGSSPVSSIFLLIYIRVHLYIKELFVRSIKVKVLKDYRVMDSVKTIIQSLLGLSKVIGKIIIAIPTCK